jgi:BirA family biotin operon repressor/biotin-[acetyl-CoA-carboxylase] ligase
MQKLDINNPFNAPVFYEETVSSTMDVSRELAARGEPHGTVIVADYQEVGRGRNKREWSSSKGENLMFTILLRYSRFDDIPVALTLRAGLSVCLALGEVFPDLVGYVKVKWPNDVMLCSDSNAKKTAGLLTETVSAQDGSVTVFLGIGINLYQSKFYDVLRDKATSISLFLKENNHNYPAPGILFTLLQCVLKRLYNELTIDNNITTWRSRLESSLYMKNKKVTFINGTVDSGNLILGTLNGINDNGELLIIQQGEGEARAFNTGELMMPVSKQSIM